MLPMLLVVSLITALLRLLPVFVFGRNGKTLPCFVQYLGRVMPSAMIGLLVVYSLKSLDLFTPAYALPEVVGVLLAAALQWKTKNTLLSIFVATACYMWLIPLF